jgi:hypothetical protein
VGGYGSGQWHRWKARKTTVEESICVAVADFRGQMFDRATGRIGWTWGNGDSSFIGYSVTMGDALSITLSYRWPDGDDVRIVVPLQTTPTQFGGTRWWFTCPLSVNGVECNRRVRKLYLPHGAQYFGCRVCHDLTYQSSQTAHFSEREASANLLYQLDYALSRLA